MRVVIIGVSPLGMLNFRGELIRALCEQGHDVVAITPEDDARVRAGLEAMGARCQTVALQRTGTDPRRDVASLWSLFQVLRRTRADAVLVYGAKPVVYGALAARLARVPVRAGMITGAGSALRSERGGRPSVAGMLLRGLYAVALRQLGVVFFQNPDDESRFRAMRLLGRRQRVVRIAGSGIDLARFTPAPIPPPPMVFLQVGRLLKDKGVREFVAAARIVRAVIPEARFQLLGSLDSNPTSVSAAELDAWRSEGVVEYLGHVDDVRPVIAAAHVLVLASYGEGLPHSVLEGMAMARPIITTDVPGCRETVVEGVNGHLVPARDAGALASAMLRIADPAAAAAMGLRSRRITEERFDVHQVNRDILDAMGLGATVPEPGIPRPAQGT
jgi:glycosyltransferase involved in cell wall biosynthesis